MVLVKVELTVKDSKKVLVDLDNFPNFRFAYYNDGVSWIKSFHNSGYPSAEVFRDSFFFVLDEIEYTHFVLRWS